MKTIRKVVFLTAKEKIEFSALPMPAVGRGEVLLRMKSVGVCGSDVAYFRSGRTGVGEIKFPHILGHECAGIVEAVGESVSNLQVGDRITTEPGFFCGKCEMCTSGRYNLCSNMSFMGSAVADAYGEGALVEYSLRPAHLCFKLPDNVCFADGAMVEPFAVALHAIRTAGIGAGQRAAILGSGPIGACILLVLKCLGIHDVVMTDVVPSRLHTMEALGARPLNVDGLDEAALSTSMPENYLDAVFDTTCSEIAINAAMRWLKKGGSIVQVGVPVGKRSIDLQTLFNKGIRLLPTFRYANAYPPLLQLMKSGALKADKIITHHFPFSQAQRALELAASRADGVMKVLIDF